MLSFLQLLNTNRGYQLLFLFFFMLIFVARGLQQAVHSLRMEDNCWNVWGG